MARETAKKRPPERVFWARGDGRPISRLADEQHGVVGRWQLLREGWSEEEIDRRLRKGRLHQLHGGVYAVGHRVVSREGRWIAAVLAAGPDAVLSHWSAAALWMVRPNERSLIDATTPHKSRSWDGIRRHHKALPADEVTVEEGIPVTTVPRTIFDLAGTEPVEVVESLIREMEFNQLRDPLSLWGLVKRYPRRRGVARLRLALERIK